MTKQCSSCGGDCGGTKKTGCLYRGTAPSESQKMYNDLIDRILHGTPFVHIEDYFAARTEWFMKECGK